MADNEYNDEYQFTDLDSIGSDNLGDDEPILGEDEALEGRPKQGKNILRNALIAIIIIVLAMLGYKFIGSYLANRKAAEDTIVPSITTATTTQAPVETPPPIQPVQTTAPVETPPAVTQPSVDSSQITQKLSDLEISQQNLRSEVNSVNNQLSSINSNVNDLSEKMASLNRMIGAMVAKMDQQSNQIAILTERTKPKPPPVRTVAAKPVTLPIYYIQAVIPGRAWLIAPNGSTLTVREGTQITGYGVIKLIDPNQGRILTSSGRVIRFSQQDN